MDIENMKNVGPKILNELKKLGINTDVDLLHYYPFRYNLIKKTTLVDNEKVVIDGVVCNNAVVRYLRNKKDVMQFTLESDSGFIKIILYNRGYLKSNIVSGKKITVIGKYNKKNNEIIASDVRFELLGDEVIIEPIYHATKSLTSLKINNLIKNYNGNITSYLPEKVISENNFISKSLALKYIHNPVDFDSLKKAIKVLKYEELFLFMLKINYLKIKRSEKGNIKKVDWNLIGNKIRTLDFELTLDQLNSVKDIYNDFCSDKRMNRLLQGDVGSGKTIVSFLALYMNFLAGYQGAIMAPTEILAKQHYDSFKKLFPDIDIVLLTGKSKGKATLVKKISDGVDVVIGTHALTSENVTYNNLGLVITDEQHRFGVNQRSKFRNKGCKPDILYMSATPIPRTYAITLFGDMDISSIKTKPVGRKEIISILKNNSEIKDVLKVMYEQIKIGHQVYVIAPSIEESENMNLENVLALESKLLQAFGKVCKIGIMHGKLTSKEKEEVMLKFVNNEIQILISTTVIEVGVDVKNATCLVVFNSERFGLSTLHQLRGRIGRNELQSYFVMISDNETERLKVMIKTNDGFEISAYDMELRGSGDLFGFRQSGDMQFKLANIKKDFKLLEQTRNDSYDYINTLEMSQIKKILTEVSDLD